MKTGSATSTIGFDIARNPRHGEEGRKTSTGSVTGDSYERQGKNDQDDPGDLFLRRTTT